MTVGGLVDTVFRFNRLCECHLYTAPRNKSVTRFHSYTFPKYGNECKLREHNRLSIQGVGELKVKLHRDISGDIKTVTLKKSCGKWYACFGVLLPSPDPLPATGTVTGIDVSISSFAVLSDETVIKNPGTTKPRRRSFAGYNEKSAAERKAVTGEGKRSNSSNRSTTISRTSAGIFTTKSHGA